MEADASHVMAVVLTHNARTALERCVAAIAAQEPRPGAILVVDNASREPVADLADTVEGLTVIRLDENLGPAGGYAAALDAFVASRYEYAWVMDDDCAPEVHALDAELRIASPDTLVLATVRSSETSDPVQGFGWWGALIPRAVVQRVGVPNAELFWWTEDTEYLQWRIPNAGCSVRFTDEPVISVNHGRDDASKPAWKYYYEARNQVHYRLYVQRPPTTPVPENLTVRVRSWRALRSVTKLGVRAVAREHDGRVAKLAMVARGTFDGLRGRLGRTVAVDDADRPVPGAARPGVEEPRA